MPSMVDIIAKKRDGKALTDAEIQFFIDGYTAEAIPDYQASALLMAMYLGGMSTRETVTMTKSMAHSGDIIDLSHLGDLSVDKHSTGGVGDKTTLVVAPLVAAVGGKVAKMSGRGLGHTGGTVDKLESIAGFSTALTPQAFMQQIDDVGVAVVGQTGNLTPADKKLYALRDVTATVDNIPLITASIMSKKLAAGSKNIVLDVKVGSGAFMKTIEDARALARNMVDIGKACGRKMAALITAMDAPLGNAVGNSLELQEAIAVLRGENHGAVRQVSVALATTMVALMLDIDEELAKERVVEALDNGKALEKFRAWIIAQGGDGSCVDTPSCFPPAPYTLDVLAKKDGYITRVDAICVGRAAMLLGAGRQTKSDTIDHRVGIYLHKLCGEKVCKGDKLFTLYAANKSLFDIACAEMETAISIGDTSPTISPLIYEIIR